MLRNHNMRIKISYSQMISVLNITFTGNRLYYANHTKNLVNDEITIVKTVISSL